MPKQLRRLVAIPIMATVLLTSSPARAQFDLEVTQDVILGVDTSIETTLAAISAYIVVMLPLIEEAIASSAASHAQANHVMLEGSMRINDAHQAQQWSLSRAEAQGESNNTAQPTVAGCQISNGSRAKFTNEIPDRVETSNMIIGTMSRMGNAPGTNSYYGNFAELTQDATYEVKQYGRAAELCPGGGCSDGNMPDSNVRADTLFQDTYINGSPYGAGTGPNGAAITANATGAAPSWTAAAKDYCANLTNTGDPDPLKSSLLGTPQGIATFAMRKAGDARMSLTQMVCSEMVAEREPNMNVPTAWGNKIMTNLQNTYQFDSSKVAMQNFSTYNMTKLLAHDQFADPTWEQNLASESSPAAILKLMNTLEAASLQMQWNEYNSLERIKLLEAVSLASKTEETRTNVPSTALPSQ